MVSAVDRTSLVDFAHLDLIVRSIIFNQSVGQTGVGITGQMYNSAQDTLTAHAGGGQANGTPIMSMTTRFTVVATIADSGTLLASVAGMEITVINAAANSMNVFPATGEQINALGANAAFALAGGKTATFFCCTAGQWHSILSA
jgi:hypothetical protein